jgi:hypothetical protein
MLSTKNNGKYTVTTVQGKIVLSLMDGKVMLTDANGGSAMVNLLM